MNLEQLAKEVIEKGEAAPKRPWEATNGRFLAPGSEIRTVLGETYVARVWGIEPGPVADFITAAADIATPLAQAFLDLKEAAKNELGEECWEHVAEDGLCAAPDDWYCRSCGGQKPDHREGCTWVALAATIERIEKPL